MERKNIHQSLNYETQIKLYILNDQNPKHYINLEIRIKVKPHDQSKLHKNEKVDKKTDAKDPNQLK